MKRTKDAFVYIVNTLKENRIPFMIAGGFAAKIYGSPRPLFDIDIWIPRKHMKRIRAKLLPLITMDLKRFKDDKWDDYSMTLTVFGVEVDITAVEGGKIYDQKLSKWVPIRLSLHNVAKKRVFGKIVPVIKPKDLIGYKSKLGREVDIKDVAYLKSLYKP